MRNAGEKFPAQNVDEYLERLPDDARNALEKLRKAIKTAAPLAEEIISYQIPTYKYFGALVHFAAFPSHLSLYVVNKEIFSIFEEELQGFKTSGTTIHFSPQKQIPPALVKKIVRTRVQQNEERKSPLNKILVSC